MSYLFRLGSISSRLSHPSALRVMRKVLLFLIDGLGDVSIPSLNNKTPLQIAHTPHLDAVAASGLNGLMDPVQPGVACGSDTAHLSLLGYNPAIYYRGRGAFESLGAGLEMNEGDVGFKCNFAFVDELSEIVVKRRADRNFATIGPDLCKDLNDLRLDSFPEVRFLIKYATEHRCGIVLQGHRLSDQIAGTDPLRDGLLLCTSKALNSTDNDAVYTARIVNALSDAIRRRLEKHPINRCRIDSGLTPANTILFRGAGQRMKAPSFKDCTGMRGCVVAPTKIIAGLAISVGLDVIEVEGATGSYDTCLSAKAAAMCHALYVQDYDFGMLHVKAVDDAGHDRNIQLKLHILAQIDKMIGQIIKRLWMRQTSNADSPLLIVTSDHSTPVLYGDHSNEPVPVTLSFLDAIVEVMSPDRVEGIDETAEIKASGNSIFIDGDVNTEETQNNGKLVVGDDVVCFDEVSAAAGVLGRFNGSELMDLILQLRRHA